MHSGLYGFFQDQGSGIAGLLALVAGIAAYQAGRMQATATEKAAKAQEESEQKRHGREVQTVRNSLALELRQMVARSYGVHTSLKNLIVGRDTVITAFMVECSIGVPLPVVYPAVADRISDLQGDAMDVVIVYQLIEIGRAGAALLAQYHTPNNIPQRNVAAVAEAFLGACTYARAVLPRLRTGVPLHDERDGTLVRLIGEAEQSWNWEGRTPP